MIKKEDVIKALSTVMDPELNRDLVSLGMIEDIAIDGDTVKFSVVLTTPSCPLRSQIQRDAHDKVAQHTGASEVTVNMKARVRSNKPVQVDTNQFKHIIAVGSGKGGVGKSTVAVNLALSLAADGASVGLLDADIYGPNIPRMLGIDHLPETPEGQKIQPAEAHGLKIVSIGFLVGSGQPLIWRGPMLHSAIQQFITDFDWGELDYFIVDLPPGTGDVQLSLAQTLPISGAVIVTTPQQVAVDDASRAVAMFEKLEVPVLGIVENMAYLDLPDGEKLYVFGKSGGEHLASRLNVTFLGNIPIDPAIVQGGDIGSPVITDAPTSSTAEAFRSIACAVASEASQLDFSKKSTG